jgi:tripartite-type tricarboxylate transporter receptor subunit TctC
MTHPSPRRQVLRQGLSAAAALALPAAWLPARAQALSTSLPDSARILVGFPPGGAPDIIARRLGEQLAGKLARAVVVENKPGAAGRIAVDAARQAPADGLTLLLNPAGVLTINPHTYKKLNYDPFKDFAPLSLAAQVDFGFGVGPAVPGEVKSIADFARWAKANPGKVSYGSPAAGSPPHFVGDAMSRALGLEMTHVPYRGGAPALNDLMGGQLAAAVLTLGDMIQHEKAGRLRLLAGSGPSRSKFAPELPTFAEQKVPGLEVRDWFAVYIAGQATPEVLARAAPLVRAATASPAYVQALAVASLDAASCSPQELDKLARADFERWAPIVKASGFVADV